jgi:urease accessory protein
MHLVRAAISTPNSELTVIRVHVHRLQLAKRIWRGAAEDGTEFGFELPAPLKPGDTIFETPSHRYVVEQEPESVVEIALDVAPSAAAGIGWAIGNLHLELSAESSRLLAPNEPAIRQLLDRLRVPYRTTEAVFRPGRFARGQQSTHELGTSHRH